MKKLIIVALMGITATTFAQGKTDTAKKVVKAEYAANPKLIIHLDLELNEVQTVNLVALFGFEPYLKTTDIKLKDVDGPGSPTEYFKAILEKMAKQANDQVAADKAKFLKADSLKSVKLDSVKTK